MTLARSSAQRKVKETEIVRACLDYLAARKIFAWRQNQGAIPTAHGGFRRFVGLRGVSDILGILPGGTGRFLAIEVKRPGGRTSPEQETFLANVTALGGVACVAHSVDELEADLKEAGVIS